MISLIRALAALAVTLAAPRLRGPVLTLFSLALVLGGGAAAIFSTSVSVALFAGLALAGLFLAWLLPRILPRLIIGLFGLFALVALPFGLIAAQGKAGLAAALTLALAALFFSVRKPDAMMRLASAGVGALLLSGIFSEGRLASHRLLVRLGCVALLFLLEELGRRAVPEKAPAPLVLNRAIRRGAALGAVGMLAVLALPLFARSAKAIGASPAGSVADPAALVQSERPDLLPLPFAERRAALAVKAPRGGLIWPLPSEAITWDEPNLDRALFPRFENLDALFLGMRTRGFAWLSPALNKGASPLIARWLGRISLHGAIAGARLVNDAGALARLRAAAGATVAALRDVLPMVHPGTPEAALEQAFKIALRRHGCGPESFPLIFASGPSAAEPHGSGNLGTLKEGTLLVADLGCSIDHYASDFTRTLPVSGTFDARQRLLYENVLAAQAAALAQCKAGAALSPSRAGDSMEKTAREVLKTRAPDHEAHMDHGLGHTVGLFVHDIFLSGPLAEGNVITLEPGTYLPGELGIRIEDTFLVTKDGCERLTEGFPAEPEAIEAALSRH